MLGDTHGSETRKARHNRRDENGRSDRYTGIMGELQCESEGAGNNSISASSQNRDRRAEAEHGVSSSGEVIEQLIRANQQQIEYLAAQNKLLSELLNPSELET